MNEFDSTSSQTRGTRTEPARIASALAAAVDRYGPSLFLDHERLKNLLHQTCPDAAREITLVLTALSEDVPQRLLAAHGDEELQGSLPGLVDRLVNNAVFDRKSAVWSVKVWAGALALPVTGLVARPAIAIPLPSYAVNFAAIVTPLSVTPVIATPRPVVPAMPGPAPTTPIGSQVVAVEPDVPAAAPPAFEPPAVEPPEVEAPAAPEVGVPAIPAIEAVEQIVVASPVIAPNPMPEAPITDVPAAAPPVQSPPPLPAWAIVPEVKTPKPPPAFMRETSRRGGLSRAGRNALGTGAVLVAVAIVVLLFRSGSLFSTPEAAPEILATSVTPPKSEGSLAPIATAAPTVPDAQAAAPAEPPPSVTPPVEAAPAPTPPTPEVATPPPAAPASVISSVEVPRLVAGQAFVVGINVSGSLDNIAAIESKVIDNHASKADDAKLTPLADLKRSTGGAWLVPFKAIDAPSRGTLRLALVDAAGQRSASKNVDLQITASPAAPTTATAPLPACTRATCGNVVSVREVEADKTFEAIVRMDDRTIRAIREPARWPVGARVQQADGRYVTRGGEPAKKAAPQRNADKAPDIFGSMFSRH